jgi:hypothetical protein
MDAYPVNDGKRHAFIVIKLLFTAGSLLVIFNLEFSSTKNILNVHSFLALTA